MLRILKKIPLYLDEIFLAGIILLNIFDMFGMLSPDLDYLKKVISWTAIGYLLYKVQFTKILFGHENRRADIVIVLSYFLLSFKIVLGYSISMLAEIGNKGYAYWGELIRLTGVPNVSYINVQSVMPGIDISTAAALRLPEFVNTLVTVPTITGFFPLNINTLFLKVSNSISQSYFILEPRFFIHRWLTLISQNVDILQGATLIAGTLILIITAVVLSLKLSVRKPSFMHVIHEEGKVPKTAGKLFLRFIMILLALLIFYVVMGNLFLEWFAFVVDAPLIMIAVFFYLFAWIKHYRKFHPKTAIFKIGNFGDNFFKKILSFFHTRNGLLLALSGMLVLHLLVDFVAFLMPYVTGVVSPLYLQQLGGSHQTIINLSTGGLLYADFLIGPKVAAIVLHLGNVIAVGSLMLLPAVLWYSYSHRKKVFYSRFWLSIFSGSLMCFLFAPSFVIKRIVSETIVGVDIMTQSVFTAGTNPMLIVAVSFLVGAAVYILTKKLNIRILMEKVIVMVTLLFFLVYIANFFLDAWAYYVSIITRALVFTHYTVAAILFLFFGLTIVFYVSGILVMFGETLKIKVKK